MLVFQVLYATAGAPLNYPKIPRVHSYDHSQQETYFSLQLPQEILNFAKQEDLNYLFNGAEVLKENIRVFFMAQNNLDDNVLFRPHYFTDPIITTAQYSTATTVSVGVFPIAGMPVMLSSPNNSFVTDGISCHPGEGGIIASPFNLQLKSLDTSAASIFYSTTIILSQRKAALTFHYLVGEMPTDEFLYTVDVATKIRDLMHLPIFNKSIQKLGAMPPRIVNDHSSYSFLGYITHLSLIKSKKS